MWRCGTKRGRRVSPAHCASHWCFATPHHRCSWTNYGRCCPRRASSRCGGVGGVAHRHLGVIHVNATFAVASDQRRSSGSQLPEPWTQIDATVAHEMWHKIEMAWEAEQFAASVEFRRALGALFACPTIEQI